MTRIAKWGAAASLTSLILSTALPLAGPARAHAATGQADTWNSRQHQPEQGQVLRKERRAGIAPSDAGQDATSQKLEQVQRELKHTGPVAGASGAKQSAR